MIYLDYEYNKTKEARVNLISCAVLKTGDSVPTTFWLHNNKEGKKELADYILANREETFVAYAATAEARSFISLGLDPKKFQWCDLYLEYRCLTNHNHRLMYGKQLIDGKEKVTSPPKNKWRRSEEEDEEANSSKPQHSLSSATYKLLGVKIDNEEKDAVRELILSEPIEFTKEERSRILKYNASDIAYLPRLLDAMVKEYKFLLGDRFNPYELKSEMFLRGDYAARTAIMESLGYPIDYTATRNFSDSVSSILRECQDEINSLFPEIHPFKRKRDRGLRWDQSATRRWLIENRYIQRGWTKTDTGLPSLSLDAFKEFFNFRHDYPSDNFGAQMVRYLGLRQHLNGFIPGGKRGSFWDSVSEKDCRVRPYFGIYGAQSARSQPKSTGFLFLKPAWMRSLCVPPSGRAVVGIDYKSQEFLIAGLLSGDKNMLDAYESGDPYLYLAKLAGAVPKDGTRKEYEKERDIFKVVTLALQYGMGAVSLANELTQKLKEPYTEAKAQRLIDLFNRSYRTHYRWKDRVLYEYKRDGFMKLPCGWYMWGDNENLRSVNNVPVQGFGSSIMRKAVTMAQDAGLDVIFTLHDAIYVEYDLADYGAIDELARAMKLAFKHYFKGEMRERANVGLDINTWSLEYSSKTITTPDGHKVKQQSFYMDPRGEKEYEKFSKYFVNQGIDL